MSDVYPEYVSSHKMNPSGSTTEPDLIGEENGVSEEFCEGMITEVYWYHPNYLGSVDLVTDLYGTVHQFFLYTP